jgi:EmrB/QacA subfamily drug resistance transporter
MPTVSLLETYGIGQRIQSDSDSFANPPATSNRLYVVESQSRDRLEFAPPKEKAMTGSNATSAKGWVLALTAAASFMVALDALVVTTALSAIRLDLGASIEALEWTVNAYNLCFAVLLLTGAALGDRFGRRRMLAAGLAIFVLASAACALTGNVGWLIAARAVQGAGAALVMPLAMALVSAAFPREERARALGIFGGITGLALIAGPIVGGAVADGLAWQWIFWINIPVGLILIPLALARITESAGSDTRLDVTGLVLMAGASLAMVWGLMRGNSAGWTSPEVVSALAVGCLLAIAFVARELRAREPMVPMRLFRSRAFASGNAASFLYSASMYGTLFFLAQFLQIAMGYSPLGAGLRLLPWTATLFVTAPIAGALVNRIGGRSLVVVGLTLQAVGMTWVGLIASPHLAYGNLAAPLIVAGCGVSMAMPAAQNSVLSSVAAHEIGKASGTFNTLRYLGGVLGIAIAVAVFSSFGSLGSGLDFADGFALAIRVSAALSLAGAVAGMALPGRRDVGLAQAEASA